ncbi:MAG TPA: hypothetical protein VFZ25_07365 [Chloroflexota bacterium]|nr:hypothetical protein [Chloroflexota bacterium]
MSNRAVRFFVKCAACDQVFWLPRADAPVPEHGSWNRRRERRPTSDTGCSGSGRAGTWIGVEEEQT